MIDAHTENAWKLNVACSLSALLSQMAKRSKSKSAFEVPVIRTAIDALHLLLPMTPAAALVLM